MTEIHEDYKNGIYFVITVKIILQFIKEGQVLPSCKFHTLPIVSQLPPKCPRSIVHRKGVVMCLLSKCLGSS